MKTKPIIAIFILLICASISSIANPKSKVNEASKTIVVISDYNKVSVGKNLSVVFKKIPTSIAVINGNSKSLDNVDFKVVNGTLFITAKRNARLRSTTIYLPVKDLAEIRLQQNAKVHNEVIMKCSHLIIYFSDDSYSSLITQGNVEYKASGETELEIERHLSFYLK
jgi:hypothetical protein